LLSAPVSAHVLEALDEGSLPLIELRQAIGSPPQTTIRSHLRTLEDLGVLERSRQNGFPGSIDYELATAGRELLAVVAVVRTWLALAPGSPIQFGSVGAKSAITALVDGWSSTIVRALAARPLSQTELNRFIQGLNYPSLGRRLGAMRLAGQIEARRDGTRGTPYTVTDWLRRAIGPVLAAARWERRNAPADAGAVDRLDVESVFLLTVPLVDLADEVSGECRLAVEVGDGDAAGVVLRVERGRVVSCVARLQDGTDAAAFGTVGGWIRALVDHDGEAIELGGDQELASAILSALQSTVSGTSADMSGSRAPHFR
jgi:DNA-binding HxlR family transcriptional regulator